MHLLTVLPRPIPPACHRSLIQPKGVDNGLDRASIRKTRHHEHHHLRRFPQPGKHRALLCDSTFSRRSCNGSADDSDYVSQCSLARFSLLPCTLHSGRIDWKRSSILFVSSYPTESLMDAPLSTPL